MTAADIAAARARVVESAAGLRLSAGWTMQPASGRELLAIDHALALSDLLLAMTMTAPDPAPAEPSLPAAVVPWVTALREVWPECVVKWDGCGWYDVFPSAHEDMPEAFIESDGRYGFAEGEATVHTPSDLVAALRKALGQEGPAKEPEVCGVCAGRVVRVFDSGPNAPAVWASHEARPGVTCGGSGMTPTDSYDHDKVLAHNELPADYADGLEPEARMRAVRSGDERELVDAGEASGLLADLADEDGRYVGALERQPLTDRPLLVLRSAP